MKEKITNMFKNKKIVIGSVAITLVAIIAIVAVNVLSKDLVLKSKTVYVEYGTNPSENIRNYLDTSKLNDSTKEDVLSNAVIDISIDNEVDKEYPPIGEYEGYISYKNETVNFKVIVQDTTAPTMVDFNPWLNTFIDVVPNYSEIYQATDLNEVTVEIDDSNIDYTTVGTYEAVVKATDTYENVFEIKITVVVNEPTLEVNKSEVTLEVGSTDTVETTVEGAENKASFVSSDTNIASVDENGTITAVSAGTATITVSANGIEKQVTVTVNEKPVTYSGSSSGGSSSGGSSSGGSSSGGNSSGGSSSGGSSSGGSSTGGGSSGSSTTDSGSTDNSNSCKTGSSAIDGKYFSSYSEMDNYFYNNYVLAGIAYGYGYEFDFCGNYWITNIR